MGPEREPYGQELVNPGRKQADGPPFSVLGGWPVPIVPVPLKIITALK